MSKELQRWADKAMFAAEPMPMDHRGRVTPKVVLLSATPDPLGSIAAACRMYEGQPTYSLAEVTDDQRRHYWEQVKKTHLKAPLEFVKLHFFMEGVTRALTHQLVRQRTAVYAQESLRFAVKENMADEVALPPSIEADSVEFGVWDDALEHIQKAYDYLIAAGIPAEDARGLLPHAVTTRVHYCTDLRNLLDHAGNRLCTQAQFEWRQVFSQIVNAIRTYQDMSVTHWQFEHIANDDLFRPVCYAMGKCPFTADFDRGCTIRERVDAGAFSEIDDSEWLLDPTAGRVR